MADQLPPPSQPPIHRIGIIAFLVVNVMLFVAVAERIVYSGESLPGIRAGSVDVGGRSVAELQAELRSTADEIARRQFSAEVGDVHLEASAIDLDLHLDTDAAVRAARAAGRTGNPFAAIAGTVLRRIRDDEIDLPVIYDDQALTAIAQRWTTEANAGVRNADIRIVDERAVVVPPQSARGVRFSEVRDALRTSIVDPNSSSTITLRTSTVQPTVGVDQANKVAAQANVVIDGSYTITGEPDAFTLSGSKVAPTLRTKVVDGTLRLDIDRDALRLVLDGRLDSTTSPPVDATFAVSGNGSISVVPSKDGLGPDLDHVAKAILAGNRRIDAPQVSTHPRRDTAWAEALGITERVSTFTTHHPCCAPRVTNIHTAAKYLNGAIIEPGEVFSLNDIVGARTEARGFVQAPVFYGEFTEDFGGGVSQVATTTFNAAFWGGFEIVKHKPHTIYFDRYPMGREATVNYPVLDLKWRNNSTHGVYVQAAFTSTSLTIALYGDKEGKTVRETTDGCSVGPVFDTRDDPRCINVIETIEMEEVERTCPVENAADDPNKACPTLPAGSRAKGAVGHTGYAVEFFRTITVPGKAPKVERFAWRYRMLPNVTLVGNAATVPPTTTVPGATTTTAPGGTGPSTTTAPTTTTTR